MRTSLTGAKWLLYVQGTTLIIFVLKVLEPDMGQALSSNA